ncbi:MAG: tRNA (adenosine(37)-N6)-threonylcarbamoyltransferase complex dimerization subunit type 1 TsaB [Paludibacteraceae bacterium]|nr:tRNA (adenosine(37)-N6)-threonylcarbamoyltransferase complex dimerization subunit type 1 TsaB [Paludibacteraceae bacterium]
MTIIALDSSTEVCSAALLQDGDVVAERINMIGSNHAALLPTYVQELQVEAASRNLTIGAVALSEGPGSYTGLRIGASLAKGLCYGMDVPLYAVPTLAVIASAAANHCSPATGSNGAEVLICPMIDARRMEVYCALYDTELREVQPLQAMVIGEQSLAEVLNSHVVVFCGNGAEKCKAVIGHPNARWIDGLVPTAAEAGRLVCAKQCDGVRTVEGKEIAYFEPNYLKEFVAAPSHVKGLH